jgi:hypothetical protein
MACDTGAVPERVGPKRLSIPRPVIQSGTGIRDHAQKRTYNTPITHSIMTEAAIVLALKLHEPPAHCTNFAADFDWPPQHRADVYELTNPYFEDNEDVWLAYNAWLQIIAPDSPAAANWARAIELGRKRARPWISDV